MKEALTVSQQISLLENRGLEVPDKRLATRFLFDCNYYRLSGYFRYFQEDPRNGKNMFVHGVSLADIEQIYLSDEVLRHTLSDGLDIVEVTFRSRAAYYLANRYGGPYGYLDPQNYANRGKANQLIKMLKERDFAQSKEVFAKHFDRKGEDIPIWAAVELMSFGTMSRLVGNFGNFKLLKDLGRSFDIPASTTRGIFQSLSYLRNLCAHHSRLWNRIVATKPPVPNKLRLATKNYGDASVMKIVEVLSHLVSQVDVRSSYRGEIEGVLHSSGDSFREGILLPRHL